MSFIVEKIPMSLYVLQALSLIIKIACMVWFFIWVRWSLPRVRYDQLMSLGWKRLFTLGLLNLIVTVVVVYFFEIN
jgi:NADH-quinone oxidoreductase subunit H